MIKKNNKRYFLVYVTETVHHEIYVEAENHLDAEKKASEKLIYDGEINVEDSFEVSEEAFNTYKED